MPHLRADDLNALIGKWVWDSQVSVIGQEAAMTIASHWQSPGTSISAYAHGFQVNRTELRDEILREGRQSRYPVDLAALLDWVDNGDEDTLIVEVCSTCEYDSDSTEHAKRCLGEVFDD